MRFPICTRRVVVRSADREERVLQKNDCILDYRCRLTKRIPDLLRLWSRRRRGHNRRNNESCIGRREIRSCTVVCGHLNLAIPMLTSKQQLPRHFKSNAHLHVTCLCSLHGTIQNKNNVARRDSSSQESTPRDEHQLPTTQSAHNEST